MFWAKHTIIFKTIGVIMPKDTGIYTTASDVVFGDEYISKVKEAFKNTKLLDNSELRESIVLLWAVYPINDETNPGELYLRPRIYRDEIIKLSTVDHYTWVEQKEEILPLDDFHIFKGDIIRDENGNKISVLKVDCKTKQDWLAIINK